jgi:hypothetical protein
MTMEALVALHVPSLIAALRDLAGGVLAQSWIRRSSSGQ